MSKRVAYNRKVIIYFSEVNCYPGKARTVKNEITKSQRKRKWPISEYFIASPDPLHFFIEKKSIECKVFNSFNAKKS